MVSENCMSANLISTTVLKTTFIAVNMPKSASFLALPAFKNADEKNKFFTLKFFIKKAPFKNARNTLLFSDELKNFSQKKAKRTQKHTAVIPSFTDNVPFSNT